MSDFLHFEEEKRILRLLHEGSEYAFQIIFDKYKNRIYKLSLKYLVSPILAQEAVQDVFLKLWFAKDEMNDWQHLEKWLALVSKNHCIDQLRKISREWQTVSLSENTLTEFSENNSLNKVIDKQYEDLLTFIINKLPLKQKEVYSLVRESKLTYLQVGERLGISPLTVKTHMSRALQSIKGELLKQGLLFSVLFILKDWHL
ncbi:RNA polymerase sigma factor [Parasediminibacterium sp. JCM 36343]|uniref:RNA polymerase sigma factor n=1 Tax=Parasediminibacterium sp. JCM 36343 TaxID=3374279 RepID=UPI0039792598